VVDPANLPEKLSNRFSETSSDVGVDLCDWRALLLAYLRDPSAKVDKNVWRSAFKYMLHNDELYRRTTEDLLLKCLGSNQARVAMGEVHEGICGTHQLALKMKWLLRRASFYWPTMMADCF
jgi:sugar diacid utilization regulator